MTPGQTHWTELLRADPERAATSWVSSRELREAVLEVGEEPMRWALQVAGEFADAVGGQMPDVGPGTPAFVSLRSGLQSSVLAMLIAVRLGAVHGDPMTEESRDSVRVSIEAGVELTTILAAVRRSHALVVERLMQECRALADPSEQSSQFAMISEVCFEFAGHLADGLTRLYVDEQMQWRDNPRATRLALVARILDGHEPDLAKAAATLRYEIKYRHHIAVSVWYTDDQAKADDQLEAEALQFLRAHQASQTLTTRQPDSTVLAWGNSRTPLTGPLTEGFRPVGGVRLAVGTPGRDVEGFRTSANDARAAQTIAKRLPGLHSVPVARFSELSLIGLLSSDLRQARRFAETELGSLADFDDHDERTLETLEAYLDSHSPQTVAQQLFIARNTVTYRLRKAEELLGRPITERQPQLRAAILLARALRDEHAR